jgi:homoserine kinase type II
LDGRIGNPSYAEIIALFRQLAPRIEPELAAAALVETKLQPAIRDVWADHFLFTGDSVTGLVDFGGLNIDTPATDIARLLGSMAGDDAAAWQVGVAAYEAIRPLTSAERQLIPVFDRSSVLLSGMNWLRWIYIEGRTFADTEAVKTRLATIVGRMRHLETKASRRDEGV